MYEGKNILRRDVYQALSTINDAIFQRLCDIILKYYNPEYNNLIPKGLHSTEDKTIKGTPDSYKEYPDGRIIAFQYSTAKTNRKKLINDISLVKDWDMSNRVFRVVLVNNSALDEKIAIECRNSCQQRGWELQILCLDDLVGLICNNYNAAKAAEQLIGIPAFRLSREDDFRDYYEASYRNIIESEIKKNYSRKLLSFDLNALPVQAISGAGQEVELKDIIDCKRALLLGAAGTGKSTYIKRLFIQTLKGYKEIPVFCELKYYEGETISEYICRHLERDGVSISTELIDYLLKKGDFILFLDGLDEIREPLRLRLIHSWLDDSRYWGNHFIISSRDINCSKAVLPGFNSYNILPLNDDAVVEFTSLQLGERASSILDVYHKSESVKTLLNNVFYLVVLIYLCKERSNAEIQRIMTEIDSTGYFYSALLEQTLIWNQERILNAKVEKSFLVFCVENIAYHLAADFNYRCNERKINHLIKGAASAFGIGEDIVGGVKNLIVECKLMQRVSEFYEFEHQNLQAYFSGKYLLSFKTDDIKSALHNPALVNSVLLINSSDLGFLDRFIEEMPGYLLKEFIKNMDNSILSPIIKDYIIRNLHIGDESELEKIIMLVSCYAYHPEMIKIIFEYLCAFERDNPQPVADNIFGATQTINELFMVFQGNLRRELPGNTVEMFVSSINYGKLAMILSSEALRFVIVHDDMNREKAKGFFSQCLESNDRQIQYYTVLNLKDYFECFKDLALYERLSTITSKNILLNSMLIEIAAAVGADDYIDCDNTQEVEDLVHRAMEAENKQDFLVGQQIASLFFEELPFLYEQSYRTREIIGEQTFKKVLLLALEDPGLDDWTASHIITLLSSFYKDEDVINVFSVPILILNTIEYQLF